MKASERLRLMAFLLCAFLGVHGVGFAVLDTVANRHLVRLEAQVINVRELTDDERAARQRDPRFGTVPDDLNIVTFIWRRPTDGREMNPRHFHVRGNIGETITVYFDERFPYSISLNKTADVTTVVLILLGSAIVFGFLGFRTFAKYFRFIVASRLILSATLLVALLPLYAATGYFMGLEGWDVFNSLVPAFFIFVLTAAIIIYIPIITYTTYKEFYAEPVSS